MDNTIKIVSEILIHEYYDLERAFRKTLKSIGSYTFDYDKIDAFVEMVDYDGIEYIITGFYHNEIFFSCQEAFKNILILPLQLLLFTTFTAARFAIMVT